MESNIKDLLTTFRFKNPEADSDVQVNEEECMGCISCNKCKLCKNFIVETKIATSYNTDKKFAIKAWVEEDGQEQVGHKKPREFLERVLINPLSNFSQWAEWQNSRFENERKAFLILI